MIRVISIITLAAFALGGCTTMTESQNELAYIAYAACDSKHRNATASARLECKIAATERIAPQAYTAEEKQWARSLADEVDAGRMSEGDMNSMFDRYIANKMRRQHVQQIRTARAVGAWSAGMSAYMERQQDRRIQAYNQAFAPGTMANPMHVVVR
jgi:hypothetical protein